MASDDRLLTPAFVTIPIAGLFFFMSAGVTIPLLPQFVKFVLGGGNVQVGIVGGAFAFSAVLTRPQAGRLGDRRGRRRLMIIGAACGAVATGLCGFATSIVPLIALRLLTGVGEGFFFTGAATLVSDMSPPSRRGEALSYFSVAVYVGIGVGPVIGQTVLDHASYTTAFLVAGALSAVGSLLSLRTRDVAVVAAPAGTKRRLVHRAALGPGGVLALGLAGFCAFQLFIPLYVRPLHVGGSQLVFLTYSVVVLAVRVLGAKIPDRLGAARVGTFAMLSIAVGLSLVSALPSAVGLYAGTIVFAIGMALQYPALMAMAVNRAAEHERAGVVGTFTAFFDLAQGLGSVALGGVAAVAGYRGAFAGGAALALLGLCLLRLRVAPPTSSAAEATFSTFDTDEADPVF